MKDCSLKRATMTPLTKPAAAPPAIAIDERCADAELIGDAREQHSAERHHRADAEVDAAGEDHQQHAEADQAVRDHLAHQVAHVALGEEGLGEPGARKQQRDEAGDEAEVERAQARLAAGEPPSFEARLGALSLHARRLRPARGAGQNLFLGCLLARELADQGGLRA